MKLISIHIYKWQEDQPLLLCTEMDLNQLW